MIQHIDNANNLHLEPVHIDWTGLRTQTTIGLLAIFFLCLINFIPFWHKQFIGTRIGYGDIYDLVLYFASCLLVTLIALEIGKPYGNRNGAAYAIWTGLLFAVFPWQPFACLVAAKLSRVISFIILLMTLIFFRMQSPKNKLVAALFLIFGLGNCILIKNIAVFHNDILCCPFYKDYSSLLPMVQEHHVMFYAMIVGYIAVGLILSTRIILQTISWRTAFRTIFCLLIFFICEQLGNCPGMIILAGAALALAIVQLCLPNMEAASASSNQSYAYMGLVALTLLVLPYEQQFLDFKPIHPFASTNRLGRIDLDKENGLSQWRQPVNY